ncbi:pentatricopeptide repeat-containing protein At5g39350-like [Wolffia australiana]
MADRSPCPSSGWQELKETLAKTLTICCSSRHLRQIHARIIASGLRHNLHLAGLLIRRYTSFLELAPAMAVFSSLNPPPNKPLIWNSLMRGCLRNGRPDLTLTIFDRMTEKFPGCNPDRISFSLAIKAAVYSGDPNTVLRLAQSVQSYNLDSDPLVSTPLIVFHSRRGEIKAAREVFDGLTEKDVISWNAMISGYAIEGSLHEPIKLFKSMKNEAKCLPSEGTLVPLLSLCSKLGSLNHGQIFHGHSLKLGFNSDVFICNSLMEMYIHCDSLDSASMLFEKMIIRDSATWSTLIGGYLHHGLPIDSIKLYSRMVSSSPNLQPSKPILLSVLLACAEVRDWHLGMKAMEDYSRKNGEVDAQITTTVIFMHAKCGNIAMAFDLINGDLTVRNDVIAWNALIKGCAEGGDLQKSVKILKEMQRRGISPDEVTLLSLISLSSSLPCLGLGMGAHAHVLKRGFHGETPTMNSLIDMYSRCGNPHHARKVFDGLGERDEVTWSSMMKAYAINDGVHDMLSLFKLMVQVGTPPNRITFVTALWACSHGGYVEEAHWLFRAMREDYGLEPWLEHYACMVDLLGKSGFISEAVDLVNSGPLDASRSSPALWGSLFRACSSLGDSLIGEGIARNLLSLEPENAANYINLARMHSSEGRREASNGVLRKIKDLGSEKKPPGFSRLMIAG